MNGTEKKPGASHETTEQKQNLRRHFKSLLSLIPGDDRRLYEFELKKNLEAFFFEKNPRNGIWASYMPMATEANPHVEIPNVTWAYPKTFGEEMRFFTLTQGAAFEPSSLGVYEPTPSTSQEVDKKDLTGMLIPGLAFSKKGQRLGRGKAYYDKYLTNFQGLKVGLAFQLQLTDEIPCEEHDVTMDYIVTNETMIMCEDYNG